MKNFLLLIGFLCIAGLAKAQRDTIKYTPMSAAGYQFKYSKDDSGHAVPFRNLSTGRGTTRPGSIVCNTADSLLYYWNGVRWVNIAGVSGGGGTFFGIDSVTYAGGTICQWKNGTPKCYPVIPGVDSVVITGNQLCQWKAGVAICYTINGDVLGTGIDSVTVNGNSLCQWTGGVATCYTINSVTHGVDSLTVVDSLLCSWSGGVSTCFVMLDTVFLADDLVTRGYTATGKQIVGRLHSDGVVSGGIITGSGCLQIQVVPTGYYLNNGIHYVTVATTLTVATPNVSLPRTDAVILDTFGIVSIRTGTPAVTPAPPSFNPASEWLLATIPVGAGATCLSININVIYDENTEYTHSTSGTITDAPGNTTNPQHLTKADFVSSYADGAKIIWTKGSGTDTVFNNSLFKFFIYLNGAFTNHMSLQLFNTATAISNDVLLDPYFNALDSNEYQPMAIPSYAMGITGALFNKLVFTLHGSDLSGAKGFYIDYIQKQTGLTNPTFDFSNKLDSVTKFQDSILLNWVKGVIIRRDTLHLASTGTSVVASTDTTKQSSAPWIVSQQVFNTASPLMSNTGSATFTYTTSGLSISGGDGTYNNFTQLTNAYTLLEDHQIDVGPFKSTVAGAGLAIGINCGFTEVAIAKVDLTAGGTKGQLSITRDKSTYPYISASNLSYSSGDSLLLRVVRSKFSVQAYFINLSTGLQVSTQFDITAAAFTGTGPNIERTGRPAIWALGGTQTFTPGGAIVYRTSSYRKPKLTITGTSIEAGYKAGTYLNAWTSLKGRVLPPYTVLAMPSATTTDVVNALPELISIHPEYAAFNIVTNDTITHVSNATTQANITLINNTCIANSIKPIWISGLPMDASFSSYNVGITRSNTFIQTLTGVTKYVNFNANVPIVTVDGVHPDSASHSALAKYFIDSTSDLFTYSNPLNFVDSLRRTALNVQARKNGVWTTQFTDSIASGWNVNGNTFSDSLNFIGTLNQHPLQFRYNNAVMGGIYGILTSIWMGAGPISGTATIASQNNSFYGWATGGTAVTSAHDNTGIGSGTLSSLTTGTDNTAGGKNSMLALTTGVRNTSFGSGSASSNISGTDNSWFGRNAGFWNTGSANTGIGGATIGGQPPGGAGINNTAIGINALGSNTSGNNNLGLGSGAGFYNTTGNSQIFINSLLKNNFTEDQTLSPIYIQENATITSQKIALNGVVGINTITPTSTFQNTGSFARAYIAKATSYTATVAEDIIAVTATGQTITLPTAVGISGRVYEVKLTASGSSTVATTSSQTIDGSTTYSLSAQYKYVEVQSDGANWNIIANN